MQEKNSTLSSNNIGNSINPEESSVSPTANTSASEGETSILSRSIKTKFDENKKKSVLEIKITSLTELKTKTPNELMDLAQGLGVEHITRMRKQDMIFAILKAHAQNNKDIYGDGVL